MKRDQASHTARFVSNGIYWVSRSRKLHVEVPGDLRDYTIEMTRCSLNVDSPVWRRLACRWILFKAGLMQRCAIPGIYLHQLLRKRFIEAQARKAIADKTNQLVVIGAGLDTLGLRLSVEHPDLKVIEIDHPATQALKRSIVDAMSLPMGDIEFLSADLGHETLVSALKRSACHDPEAATLFIAEGITMYLSEASVRELLNSIANQPPGSSLLFTYMEESRPGCFDFRNARRVTSWWLALRHERFTWGIRPDRLQAFLAECGLSLESHRTPEELRLELLIESNRNATLALGENTVLAITKGKSHA